MLAQCTWTNNWPLIVCIEKWEVLLCSQSLSLAQRYRFHARQLIASRRCNFLVIGQNVANNFLLFLPTYNWFWQASSNLLLLAHCCPIAVNVSIFICFKIVDGQLATAFAVQYYAIVESSAKNGPNWCKTRKNQSKASYAEEIWAASCSQRRQILIP